MIKSFSGKETELIWNGYKSRSLPVDMQKIAKRKLILLNAACSVNELRVPPGNRLEKLKGERSKQHSIRINDQWRICFIWDNGNCFDVEIVDYH